LPGALPDLAIRQERLNNYLRGALQSYLVPLVTFNGCAFQQHENKNPGKYLPGLSVWTG